MRLTILLLGVVLLSAACRPTPAPPAWTSYRDERTGFSLRHPEGWTRTEVSTTNGGEVRFVPGAGTAAQSAEFIVVFTVETGKPGSEFDIRRTVFGLLPVHGVSGFQQDPRTTPQVLWYRFEVAGSTAGTEWASVGVAAAGGERMQIAVCAKALPQWREGQKQCDEVVRSFVPGELNGR